MRKEKFNKVRNSLSWRMGGYWGKSLYRGEETFEEWKKEIKEIRKGHDGEEDFDFFYFKYVEDVDLDDNTKNNFYDVDREKDGEYEKVTIYHNFTKLNMKQLDIVYKIHTFYEDLLDLLWERDDGEEFKEYQISMYEDINPYDTLLETGDDFKIETAAGCEININLSAVLDIDRVKELRQEWALEAFSEDEDRNLFIPFLGEYLKDYLEDEKSEKLSEMGDVLEDVEKIIMEELENDIYEISEREFSCILYIYLKNFYEDPFDLLKDLKNYY